MGAAIQKRIVLVFNKARQSVSVRKVEKLLAIRITVVMNNPRSED